MPREAFVEVPERLQLGICEMCQKTVEMLELTWEGFRRQDSGPLQPAEQLGREIHRQEKVLTEFAVKSSTGPAGGPGASQELLFIPIHLERIGDQIALLIRATQTMLREGIPFTERAMRELNTLYEKGIELLECVRDVIQTKNRVLIRHILQEGERYEAMADAYALSHQQRLIEGVCMPKASSIFVAMLDYLKGIEWHVRQIAQKLAAV
jgi:Na+/phosphate symporter